MSVEGLVLSRTSVALQLWETNDTVISGNNITASKEDGIDLASSFNDSISGNNITANRFRGIYLDSSSSNTILGNNITNNAIGIWLVSSSNNLICHNNFVNSTDGDHVIDFASSSANTWDDGYLSGGNYWSDYNGTDVHRGAYQNETGSDGVGDTPYTIDPNNEDHYPLMTPWHQIPGDINFDGKVSLQDLIILTKAYGSKPGDANWNPVADILGHGKVDLADIVTLANHYGQHYP